MTREEVCTHEAGHVVLALHRGRKVKARIWFDGKEWRGETTSSDRCFDAVIAVAGLTANNLHRPPGEIMRGWRAGRIGPSPGDLEHIPQGWDMRAATVEEVHAVLAGHVGQLRVIALSLHLFGRWP